MNAKNIAVFSFILLFPWISMAATIDYFYSLTGNSHYTYSYVDYGGTEELITDKTQLTGILEVNLSADLTSATLNYSNVLLNGSTFRPIDTLVFDQFEVINNTLTSGFTGEFDYISYGNATLSPDPFVCVECGYEMTFDLFGDPLVLSYHEFNSYGTGEAHFELFVSQVPLPATVWLFVSGLIGLLGVSYRKHT
ncbi:hypothetical protein ACFL3P_01490 [Pseudomonadota bacterium]